MKIRILAVVILVVFFVVRYSQATDNPSPILVELFTSEGCSSCPPADAWLQRMDSAQPLPGVHLIVLSEHVDYWNHDGWKDPYSSSLVTERQNDYMAALKLKTPYTPQVIVDGTSELRMTDEGQMEQTFQQAETSTKIPIHISAVKIDSGNSAVLHAHIEIDQNSTDHSADIYEAVALDHAESQVLRGENSGRRLTHVAVVENLTKIGKLDKSKSFSKDIEIKLKPGVDPKNIRLVIFAQESGPGRVLGAALQEGVNQ